MSYMAAWSTTSYKYPYPSANDVDASQDHRAAKTSPPALFTLLEDKFGKAVVKGATEIEVKDEDHFEKLVAQALKHCKTKMTFRNDNSKVVIKTIN